MTTKEAIKLLHPDTTKEALFGYEKEDAIKLVEEACIVACECMEKQIPKKPNYEGDGYYNGELVLDTWICPNCSKSYEVDYDDYDYCPNCAQHIDHSTLTEDD